MGSDHEEDLPMEAVVPEEEEDFPCEAVEPQRKEDFPWSWWSPTPHTPELRRRRPRLTFEESEGGSPFSVDQLFSEPLENGFAVFHLLRT